jgi:riboflavin synthase
MFTGIVEERGRVRAVEPRPGGDGARIEIEARAVLADTEVGASMAVNGCCLTVVDRGADWWAADAVPETLERTALGALRAGDAVNLERPIRLGDRLGGHLVQGHVDAVGSVARREQLGDGSTLIEIAAPGDLLRYVVEKGSITVDGVSLTITEVGAGSFSVAIVPHTAAVTTLGQKTPGGPVNLEVDVVAKYVERLLDGASMKQA